MRNRAHSALLGLAMALGIGNVDAETQKSISFEIDRSKGILPVRINDPRPLRLILDSGMPGRGVVLFKKELGEELNLRSPVLHRISGAGRGLESTAIRVDAQRLHIGESEFSNQPVVVLQNETMSGFPTDGVIGNTIFGSHAVCFEFEKKVITLQDPGSFRPDASWEKLEMPLNENGIPFIEASVSVAGEKEIPLHVYVDSASSESLELLVGRIRNSRCRKISKPGTREAG